MPTVPFSSQPRVSPQPLPGARLNPNAPQDAFGGGIASQTLPDLSGVANEATSQMQWQQRARMEEVAKANQIATTHAYSALTTGTNDILHGEDGVLNRQGKDAFTSDQDAYDRFGKQSADIRESLGTQQQKDIFDKMVLNEWNSVDNQVQSHIAAQRKVFDKQGTDSLVEAKRIEAVKSYSDQPTVDGAIATQQAAITDYLKRNGAPDDLIANKKAEVESATRFEVLQQFIDNKQDRAASAYLAKYRGAFVGRNLTQAETLVNHASIEGEAQRQSDAITGLSPSGQIQQGTIDLTKRPRVANPDGSVSTVRSISIEEDGKTVLIPTVSPDGKVLSDDEAVKLYHESGQQLGVFRDEQSAQQYANRLHESQAAMLQGQGDGTPPQAATNLEDALKQAASIQDPRLRKETETRVRAHFAAQATADRQQRQQAFQRASQTVETSGDFHRVPLADRVLLTPSENAALQRRADQIANPRKKTDTDTFAKLMNMSALSDSSRREFESLDLTKYHSGLSEADFKRLLGKQATMREQDRTRAATSARRDSVAKAKGAPKGPADAGAALEALRAKGLYNGPALAPKVPGSPLNAQQTPKTSIDLRKPPTDDEQEPQDDRGSDDAPAPVVPSSWLEHDDADYQDYLTTMGVAR